MRCLIGDRTSDRADRLGWRRIVSGSSWDIAVHVLREPLVHFMFLGGAIFAIGHHLEDRSRLTRITITQEQIRGLSDNYRSTHGEGPSAEQVEEMIVRLIEEEIFYREALKLGLDDNDEIVRRRLVQKFKFLQQDLTVPKEPTRAQLLEFYSEHSDRYCQPQTVTFSHVYFSPDRRGEEGARTAAQQVVFDLSRRGSSTAPNSGDPFPGNHRFTAATPSDLARLFGQDGLAQQVFAIGSGTWSGPLRSGLGWHAVFVEGHVPPQQIPFDQVSDEVRQDYLEAERDRHNAILIDKLHQNYEIVRE